MERPTSLAIEASRTAAKVRIGKHQLFAALTFRIGP
jgi:hypothetical protein